MQYIDFTTLLLFMIGSFFAGSLFQQVRELHKNKHKHFSLGLTLLILLLLFILYCLYIVKLSTA